MYTFINVSVLFCKIAQSRLFGSNLWIVGTHEHYKHTQHFQLHRCSLLESLLHKASTVTFNNPHSAREISTGRRLIKTKRKRGEKNETSFSASQRNIGNMDML
jgi:hypothetical protein